MGSPVRDCNRPGLRLGALVNVDRGPGFVGSVAEVFKRTLGTFRLARDADAAAMMDDLVGEVDPLAAWDDVHEVLLDFSRVGVFRQLKAAGDALHVSVNHDAVGHAKP